jgi:triosephosphate isomerase (TIM)
MLSCAKIEAVAAVAARFPPHVDILICPPTSLLADAARTASGRICIGGRTVTQKPLALIPATSAKRCLIKDVGASAVIAGHSKRRQHHGETDAFVAGKALAARRAGLHAILCVGETQQPARRLRPRRDRAGARCVERQTRQGRPTFHLGHFRAACSSP